MTLLMKRLFGAMAMGLVMLGCAGHGDVPPQSTDDEEAQVQALLAAAPLPAPAGHAIQARGAFSCDFGFDATKAAEPLGVEIERDRIFLQKELLEQTSPKTPGMIQKHIPFTPTGPTTAFAGGRYLFQGRAQAATYATYVKHSYTYPGTTQFLQRPDFSDPECRDWTVLVAWEFQPLDAHTVLRTERFDTGRTTLAEELTLTARLLLRVPALLRTAKDRGYAEVQLVQSFEDHKVQLVYFGARMSGPSPVQPDVVALGKIQSDAPLGDGLSAEGLTRVLDRPGLVLTIWRPYAPGDHGEASLWPNSPPVPMPACGDGLCTPSRGESNAACPADCTASCGDAVCQAGEDQDRCPSDCGHPFVP